MTKSTLSIRMDRDLKKQFRELCEDMGMTMTEAFTIFAEKSVREYRIPFEIVAEIPNKETAEAMNEGDDILRHPERYKGYSDVDEMFADILK